MENAVKPKPDDIREQYERQLKQLQDAYREAMKEVCPRKKGSPCWKKKSICLGRR